MSGHSHDGDHVRNHGDDHVSDHDYDQNDDRRLLLLRPPFRDNYFLLNFS